MDHRPRRRRLAADIVLALEHRLVALVDEIGDAVAKRPQRSFREVIVALEDTIGELSDHYARCREMLGE